MYYSSIREYNTIYNNGVYCAIYSVRSPITQDDAASSVFAVSRDPTYHVLPLSQVSTTSMTSLGYPRRSFHLYHHAAHASMYLLRRVCVCVCAQRRTTRPSSCLVEISSDRIVRLGTNRSRCTLQLIISIRRESTFLLAVTLE